jgi:hypothetical protein
MIYLLITTSINNRFGTQNDTERKERYLHAISETLKVLPYEIKPLIVENNGKRETYLDNFYHHHRQHVKVFYTSNNKNEFKNKAANELLDIKEVIERYGIEDDDIIIKLTGRYRALSSKFFKDIIENENKYDAFVKFFNVNTLMFSDYDCILGCYAIRAKYFKFITPYSLENFQSAEVGFAKYVKFSIPQIKEIENLDIECCFSDDLRRLVV